jgi:MFS family permease
LSRVAALGYLGFLLGPVVIGAAADLVGLARAILVLPLLALLIAAAAAVVGTAHRSALDR